MREQRRILVITSCTGVKATVPSGGSLPAERLYAGEQHRRLMLGVNAFRSSRAIDDRLKLDLWILSANHGLVRGDEPLGPYDRTFAGMRRAELAAHAERLQIPRALSGLLSTRYALALILLGENYLRAAALDRGLRPGGPIVAICGKAAALRLGGIMGLRPLVVGTKEARRFACGLVGLKGELARRALVLLARSPKLTADLANPHSDLLDLLEDDPAISAAA